MFRESGKILQIIFIVSCFLLFFANSIRKTDGKVLFSRKNFFAIERLILEKLFLLTFDGLATRPEMLKTVVGENRDFTTFP